MPFAPITHMCFLLAFARVPASLLTLCQFLFSALSYSGSSGKALGKEKSRQDVVGIAGFSGFSLKNI